MKTIMPLFEDLVKELCGSGCVKLVKIMEAKDNISEFDLADKMSINVNEMRSLLYKLSEKNLVYSTRKKDKEKGWYIYYWSFNFKHARDLLIKRKEEQLEDLNKKLSGGSIPKYICENGCGSYELEAAMELSFRCPECNSLLKLREINYKPEIIKKRISELEEQLDVLHKAIIIERIPIDKKEKKKTTRKKTTKKVKKKIKKKTKKKSSKKSSKKKVVKKKTSRKKTTKKKEKSKPIKKKVVKKKTAKKKTTKKKKVKKKTSKKLVKKKTAKKKTTKKKSGIIRNLRKRIKF